MNEDQTIKAAEAMMEAAYPYLTREIKLAPPSPPEKTAAEYREEAKKLAQAREESWERSDTDGFLTQWACGLGSSLASRRAEIKENGGKWTFQGLYRRADGARIRAKMIDGKYGPCWAICDEHSQFTGQFFSCSYENSHRSKLWKAGLEQREEEAPAWADMDGEGYGLSGRAWVSTYRIDGGYPLDAVDIDSPVEEEEDGPGLVRRCDCCGKTVYCEPVSPCQVNNVDYRWLCEDCYAVANYELNQIY